MLYIYFIFTALKLLVIWNGNSNILSFGSVIIDSLVFEVYMVSNDVLSSNERSSDVFDLFIRQTLSIFMSYTHVSESEHYFVF